MFILLVSGAASFLLLPLAYTHTSAFMAEHILAGYGAKYLDDALFAWKVLLALLIFATLRAVLKLVFSAASLALAMRVVATMRDR